MDSLKTDGNNVKRRRHTIAELATIFIRMKRAIDDPTTCNT
jgi:hypothetical protein